MLPETCGGAQSTPGYEYRAVCDFALYEALAKLKNGTTECCAVQLSKGQLIGLSFASQAGLISVAAITGPVVIYAVRRQRRPLRRLLEQPAAVYYAALFTADTLQAIGGVMDIRWVRTEMVTRGSYCVAQGVVQQLGETSVAMINLALVIHSFVIYVLDQRITHKQVVLVLVLIFSFVGIFVGSIAGSKAMFEGPTPFWCWIDSRYASYKYGEYIFLWSTPAVSLLYIPASWLKLGDAFVLPGPWTRDPRTWRLFRRVRAARPQDAARRRARRMWMYPVVYSFVILPICIIRWTSFHNDMPSAATFSAIYLFNLSGATNVFLMWYARRNLTLADDGGGGPLLPGAADLGASAPPAAPAGQLHAPAAPLEHEKSASALGTDGDGDGDGAEQQYDAPYAPAIGYAYGYGTGNGAGRANSSGRQPGPGVGRVRPGSRASSEIQPVPRTAADAKEYEMMEEWRQRWPTP